MSAQSARKKRIGSRRRITHQNETSEADESNGSSVAHGHTPEESAESVNILANPDNSRSESQSPPSPELPGNRRKLGSSRRNKGQHVKSLATEPYHKPREEVEGKNRGNETPEPSQVAHAVQPERQEELRQATYNSSLYLASTPDNSDVHKSEADLERSVPKIENLPTDQEENYTDSRKLMDTMLQGVDKSDTLQSEEVKENAHLVSVSDLSILSVLTCPTVDPQPVVTTVVTQFSSAPEITTDETSLREQTDIECSVEQAELSSPEEELSTNEEQKEHVKLLEDKDAQHFEDNVNKVHDQEIKPIQMHKIVHPSESVIHDAKENSEMISGHLIDSIAQVTDTHQPQLMVKSTDDSATNQEVSYPDNKQDEHPTKQINFEALGHTNEDDCVYDTKTPQISDIGREDTALGQEYEGEGRVVDDLKTSAVRTVHQEKEGILSEFEESESSVQTMKSEIHTPVDSQHEQSDSDFSLIGNRRKLGSSRRKKGREHVNESVAESYHKPTEEDGGNTMDDNPPETTKMSLTIETAVKEKSMETLLEEKDTFDTHQTEEVSDQVKENAHGGTLVGISELTKSILHSSSTADEQLISLTNSTEISEEELSNVYSATDNETEEIDDDTELLTQDGNSQGNVLVSESHLKSEETESSTTIDTTTGKGSPREHPQPEYSVDQAILLSPKGELPTNEEQNEMFDIENAQNSDYVSNKMQEQEVKLSYTNEPQISDTDRVDTVLGQEYEGEGQVGDDIKPSGEQTVHQEKEGIVSEVEDGESSSQTLQSETHAPLDSQPQDFSVRTEEQTHTGFNSTESRGKFGSSRGNKLEQQVKDSDTESYREHKEDFKVEVSDTSVGVRLEQIDKSDTLQSEEVRWTHHSGDAVNKVHGEEVAPSQMQETPQIDDFSESVIHDATENSEIISGHLIDSIAQVTDTHQPQLMVKSTDDSATNQEVSYPDNKQDEHPTKQINFEALGHTNEDDCVYDTKTPQISDISREDTALGQEYEGEGRVVDDLKPSAVRTVHQEKEGILSEFEESESSVQTMKSEIHTPVDSQHEQSDSDFSLIGNRRKLGSSRRKKGREHVNESVAESYHKPTEEDGGNTMDDNPPETTIETAVIPEDISSVSLEIATEKSSAEEHSEIECNVEQATFSSSIEELSTNEEQKEHVNTSQVRGAQHSDDAVNEVHGEEVKPTEMQDMHKIDHPSVKENKSSLKTPLSEMNAPPDFNLDNSQSIKEQSHTSPTRNKRKFGSSRRSKGSRQHVKDEPKESEESRGDDEALETTKMLIATETMWLEELKEKAYLKPSEEIRSTVNDKENTPKMLEEDNILLDITSSSSKDDSVKSNDKDDEEEKKHSKEPEDLCQFTGYDTVKMDSIQSPEVSDWKDDSHIENISCHDDKITAMSITANVPEQEEAFHVQNTEVLSCDKDSLGQEMNMQLTNDAIETVGPQLCGQDEVGEKLQDSTKKDHEAQEMNASQGDPFSASHNKNDTLAPCDTGLEENFRAEQAADVTEESGLPTAVTACTSQLGTEESADLQEKSKQKRRKMGSTRRTLSGKPEGGKDNKDETKESDFNIEANVRKLEKMEIVEELPMKKRTSQSLCYEKQLKTNETSSGDNKGQTQQSCTSDLQSIQSNMSDIDELKAFPLEQSASYSEEVVNPVRFVQVTDARNTERNVDVSMESSQLDDLTGNEMHITSVQTLNTEDATKKGSFESSCGIKMSTENDEEKPESVNTIQDQGLKSDDAPVVAAADLEIVKSVIRGGAGEGYENDQASMQELNDVDDVAHNKNLEMNSASPNLNSPNRRRKMGSTRRSLGSRTQDSHQKQGVDNDATETAANVGDVKSECLSGIKENELQPYIKRSHSESQQREEKVFETVECSHTGESYFKPPARQTFEENPVSHGQLIETEPQLTPNYLPAIPRTSPKHDLMSESASGGRRRKLGSHRKSRGHQNNEDQTERGDKITETQKGRDVTSITDESTTTTTEEESLGLDKIAEVDESDKKPSSNISTSMLEKHSRPKSEKTPERVTPVQHPYAGIHLGQQSQKTYSLGETPTANSYNVLMIGDSSVGKTSFIERAQSGKFSLDLPASVGLDSSLWTVVVDGKPVVLRLWDTAGQERFHSLTRQIFHKAQAFLLMYDITSSQSFSAVSYWASCIQEGAAEDVTILLLGNKSDHAKRQVKTEQGATLATEYNFTFMECSAATGENVIQSLETVARMLSQKVDTTEEVLLLRKEPQQRKSSGCC